MIYFDNAATSFPKPVCVKNAINSALVRYGANPGRSGHDLSTETAKQIYEVRMRIADMFGASQPEHVVFTPNCTYALNTAIKGLLRHGDHVILSDLEHNSMIRPVHSLSIQGMITYSIAKTSMDEEETVTAFRNAIKPNTRAIFTTHASNVFGIKLPIKRLCALAKEYGLYLLVDAAQTAGTEPIDMNWGIDFLCMPGHKGLYGPSGTGVLITPLGERLNPLVEGGTGSASQDLLQPDFMPDRLESGTINTAGIIGLGAGLKFISQYGQERLAHKEMELATLIYDQLKHMKGVELYTTAPKKETHVPLISFNLQGLTSEETTERLNQRGFALRGGLHCAPLAHKKFGTIDTGTARIGIGAFNTTVQANSLTDAIWQILNEEKSGGSHNSIHLK